MVFKDFHPGGISLPPPLLLTFFPSTPPPKTLHMNKKMALVLHAMHVDTHLALSLESTFPLDLRMYKVGINN